MSASIIRQLVIPSRPAMSVHFHTTYGVHPSYRYLRCYLILNAMYVLIGHDFTKNAG